MLKLVLRLFCKTSFSLPPPSNPPQGEMLGVTGSNGLQKYYDNNENFAFPFRLHPIQWKLLLAINNT